MFSTSPAESTRFSRRTLLRATALGAGMLASSPAPTTAIRKAADSPGAGMNTWLFGPLDRNPVEVSDAELSTVVLPHNVADLPLQSWDPSSWERTWIYRKHFTVPHTADLRHFLRFEGAATTTTVFVNGHPFAKHAGGYLPFEHEITSVVGEQNTADVVVDGRFDPTAPPNHGRGSRSDSVDFWQPAGLYREAGVISRPADHIADVFAKPVSVLDGTRRRLDVQCTLDLAHGTRNGRIDIALRRGERTVATTTSETGALPPGRHVLDLSLDRLPGITLWDTENPVLYDVATTLSTEAGPVDSRSVRTGFREARFDRSGFWLNGRQTKLFGLNRHQLFPFDGSAMPSRVQRRDAEILRNELNCNMVRCSHYPPDESFLDACDELGLLVWEEPPGWQHLGGPAWRENARRDLRVMIERDRNHPSVAIWAARLNETPDDPFFCSGAEELAKSLDDSRPTGGAIRDCDYGTTHFEHDVFGYNDYTHRSDPHGKRRPTLAEPRADHPYLVTEAVGTLSGPAKAYRRKDSPTILQDQALAHAQVHDQARADPRYAGLLGWAGFDYPSGHGNTVDGVKATGVVDLLRVPKPGSAFYRAQVDPNRRPVLEPSFAWDFHPSGPVPELGHRAAIWSNLDRLELFLDGAHHQSLLPARREFPHLAHPPFFADLGACRTEVELRVDGYLGDDLLSSRRFCSDRNRDLLRLTVDDPELVADGSDATRAEFSAVDAFGANRLSATGEVAVSLAGPAMLVGPTSTDLGKTGGAAAVWLRTLPGSIGPVRITARHATLGQAEASLQITGRARSD